MVSHQVHRDTGRTARAARGPLVALSPRVRGLAKLLVLVALLVAAALAVRASPARGWLTPRGIEQLLAALREPWWAPLAFVAAYTIAAALDFSGLVLTLVRSEEHTSELQSLAYLVCRLLLEKKKNSLNTPRAPR